MSLNKLSIADLRTLCNKSGHSCYGSGGKFLSKSQIINVLKQQHGGVGGDGEGPEPNVVLLSDVVNAITNNLGIPHIGEGDASLELFNNQAQMQRQEGLDVDFDDEYDGDLRIAIIDDDDNYLQNDGHWGAGFNVFLIANYLQ